MARPGTLAIAILLTACASPRPLLYPNEKLQRVGSEAAEMEIEECLVLAEYAGASRSRAEEAGDVIEETTINSAAGAAAGAAGGAIRGRAGVGAAVGAATAAVFSFVRNGLRYAFGRKPDRLKHRFVERCLSEKDYVVIGWK